MIRIRAVRDKHGFVYTVLSTDARESFETRDIDVAAEKLRREYGIDDPHRLLKNAAKWGSIEVVDYPDR